MYAHKGGVARGRTKGAEKEEEEEGLTKQTKGKNESGKITHYQNKSNGQEFHEIAEREGGRRATNNKGEKGKKDKRNVGYAKGRRLFAEVGSKGDV